MPCLFLPFWSSNFRKLFICAPLLCTLLIQAIISQHIFLPDIKVLHTNCFCQYNESVFPFLNLLAARNGVFFCILLFLSYFCLQAMTKHTQTEKKQWKFLPLWCLLFLTSPYLKWVRSELNSENCLWMLSPLWAARSTKFRHSFLVSRQIRIGLTRGIE